MRIVQQIGVLHLIQILRERRELGYVLPRGRPDKLRASAREECAEGFGEAREVEHFFRLELRCYLHVDNMCCKFEETRSIGVSRAYLHDYIEGHVENLVKLSALSRSSSCFNCLLLRNGGRVYFFSRRIVDSASFGRRTVIVVTSGITAYIGRCSLDRDALRSSYHQKKNACHQNKEIELQLARNCEWAWPGESRADLRRVEFGMGSRGAHVIVFCV